MDNVTHSLVGLAAAKAGLERLSPGATALCVLAANAPDADVVTTLWGKWFYLHHHRGITHSIVGTLTLALALPLLFYACERVVARIFGWKPRFKLRGLLIASLLVTATHPLMDWTNNYGVRPLLPWSGRWFYGDLVYIVDPVIWLVVGGACFLLTARGWWRKGFWMLLGLVTTTAILLLPLRTGGPQIPVLVRILWIAGVIASVVFLKLGFDKRWGSRAAIAALCFIVVYWSGLGIAHAWAYREASLLAREFASARGEQLKRLAAMPSLADATLWRCVGETDSGATFLFNLDLKGGNSGPLRNVILYESPKGVAAELVGQAARDERTQIFLDFARFPVVETEGDCLTKMFVQFADLRYTVPTRGSRGTFSLEVPVECPPEEKLRQAK